LIALSIAAGISYQLAGTRADRRRFTCPGHLVRCCESELHIRCTGQGGPAVVLEAGIAASSVSWGPIQEQLSKFTTVCSYDRAGLAWSPRSAHPRTPDRIVDELHAVISQLPEPVVLVGHSFGALIARLYGSRHPDRLAGMVLVDPALLDEWADPTPQRRATLARGVSFSRRGAALARLGIVRLSLSLLARGSQFFPKFIARASSGEGLSVTERLVGEVRKLPPETWPVVQSHWCRPESFMSMAEHLQVLPAVAAAVQRAGDSNIPVIVISGGHLTPEQRAEHKAIADASPNGHHIVAEGAAHWVHLDRPDLIVAAVHSLLNHG
jgi:pimeloyl-ACP methyl ester carboxylesterase